MTETIDTAALAKRIADALDALDVGAVINPPILVRTEAEARALAALLRGVVDGPKVKPLEWHWDPPYSTARAICGHYAVERWEDYAGLFHFDLIGSFITKRDEFSTLAEAKSAAQADYEQRIRSALVLPAPPLASKEA